MDSGWILRLTKNILNKIFITIILSCPVQDGQSATGSAELSLLCFFIIQVFSGFLFRDVKTGRISGIIHPLFFFFSSLFTADCWSTELHYISANLKWTQRTTTKTKPHPESMKEPPESHIHLNSPDIIIEITFNSANMLRYLCWFYYNVVAELGEEKAKDVPGNTVNFKTVF